MAALPEMKLHENLVEVYTALPIFGPIECPLFSILDNKWIFRFVERCENSRLHYYAYIIMKNANNYVLFKPFTLSYRADIINGTNFSGLYPERYLNLVNKSFAKSNLFRMSYFDFLDLIIPRNYTGSNIFKFSFIYFLPSEPEVLKFQIKSQEKCVQTASYLNADASTESLVKDFSKMLDSGSNHDVEVKCKEHTVKVHKAVLSARSNVFQTMLQSDLIEVRTGIVEIQDMDSSSFLDFIKYIYTDLLPELTSEKAIIFYETGDKYDIKSLSMRCSEYLQDNLSLDNVCRCLALADAHSDEKLKSKAISFILNKKFYLQEEHWLPFCESYPKIAIEVYRLSHKNIPEQ